MVTSLKPNPGCFGPALLITRAHQREAHGQVRPQDRVPAGVVDGPSQIRGPCFAYMGADRGEVKCPSVLTYCTWQTGSLCVPV